MPDPAGLWDDFKTTVSLTEDETTVLGNMFTHFFVTNSTSIRLPEASALLKKILAAREEQIIATRAASKRP
jgi:hypothetical protein